MRILTPALIAVLMLLFGSVARADPTWTMNYPKTGTAAGTILLKGTYTVPAGYKTGGSVQVVAWPTGGGIQVAYAETILANQIGAITFGEVAVGGLTSGKEYWVIFTIAVTNGTTNKAASSDPAKATAK